MVAKYLDNEDTYISVLEALKAAAWHEKVNLAVQWLDAEDIEDSHLNDLDGILVPGGFGKRGIEGKSRRQLTRLRIRFHILDYA